MRFLLILTISNAVIYVFAIVSNIWKPDSGRENGRRTKNTIESSRSLEIIFVKLRPSAFIIFHTHGPASQIFIQSKQTLLCQILTN